MQRGSLIGGFDHCPPRTPLLCYSFNQSSNGVVGFSSHLTMATWPFFIATTVVFRAKATILRSQTVRSWLESLKPQITDSGGFLENAIEQQGFFWWFNEPTRPASSKQNSVPGMLTVTQTGLTTLGAGWWTSCDTWIVYSPGLDKS